MTAATPTLPGNLDAGLRRLRLGAMRRLTPELLVTAKTQRWTPEEFLRTLGRSRNGAGSYPSTPPPSASLTDSCTTPCSSPPKASPTA